MPNSWQTGATPFNKFSEKTEGNSEKSWSLSLSNNNSPQANFLTDLVAHRKKQFNETLEKTFFSSSFFTV